MEKIKMHFFFSAVWLLYYYVAGMSSGDLLIWRNFELPKQGRDSCLKINKYYVIFRKFVNSTGHISNSFSYDMPATLVSKLNFKSFDYDEIWMLIFFSIPQNSSNTLVLINLCIPHQWQNLRSIVEPLLTKFHGWPTHRFYKLRVPWELRRVSKYTINEFWISPHFFFKLTSSSVHKGLNIVNDIIYHDCNTSTHVTFRRENSSVIFKAYKGYVYHSYFLKLV